MFPDKFVCLIAVATVHNKVVFVLRLDWVDVELSLGSIKLKPHNYNILASI